MKQRKPAKKRANGHPEPTAAEIARMAGVSMSLVYRKLQEGRTPAEIVTAAQQRREQFVLRDLPTTQVNGHAANGVLSFAAAQAAKENWLAELRKLEVMRERGELIPTAYVRIWGTRFLMAAKDEMQKAPGELQDVLAAESDPVKCRALLEKWVERVLTKFYELERLWGPPIEGDAA